MKNLIISSLLILFSTLYAEDLADKRVNQTELNYDIRNYGSDEAFNKKWEENRAGKVQEPDKYFKPTSFSSCESPADYVCPQLVDDKAKERYRTRINFIDLKNGQISCSVLPPLQDEYGFLTNKTEIPLFTATFTNKGCVEKYSTATNIDKSDEIEKLKKENEEFITSLQQQEYKYTVDYKYSGGDEFLDLADVLDGLVSFDGSKFNIEQTLLTKELKTNMGYTVLPNDTVMEKFTQNLKSFTEILGGAGWNSDRFYQEVENQARIRNVAGAIANSSYFMLLDFWVKSNELIVSISQILAFLFVGYNVIFTWISPAITNKLQKKDSGENSPQRGLFGLFMLLMLFSGEVDKIDIEYESKTDDIVRTQLIVEQTNLQSLIQLLYSETNWVADSFTEIGMRAFMNSLNSSTGLLSESQIDALASERMILTKAKEKYAQIETDMCFSNYDVRAILGTLTTYRTKTLNSKEGGEDYNHWLPGSTSDISSLKANPYPKTEREANAMFRYEKLDKNHVNVSPYNSIADTIDSGLVKATAVNKFRDPYFSPLLMSGCYYNKKKMIETESRLRAIEKEFNQFKSDSQKNAKVEYLRMVNEIQWSLYAKQGYLSIAYLPATAMLIDNLGIVGDAEKQKEALEGEIDKDDGAMTGIMQDIAESVPYLTMFGGYQIAKMVHPIKDTVLDFIIDKVSMIGGVVGHGATKVGLGIYKGLDMFSDSKNEIDVIDLWIASFIIKNIFTTLVFVTLITGTILIFTLLFIEKLFAFVSSMFLLIYAFSKNQEERVSSAVAKIFAVAFKTVLIVICVFLSMYSLNLVTSLETIFVESFFKSMDMIENASWSYAADIALDGDVMAAFDIAGGLFATFFKKYIFIGVTKFAFMMLKLVLIIQMLWKMPGYMYELIYEKVQSVSDSVGDTLQSVNESQTMRV